MMQERKTGQKYRRMIGTLLLAGALLATQIPVSDVEATASSPSDFRMNGSTLVGYTGTATTVSVPDSVKTIAAGAFSGDTDLYTVHLPKNLERIENDAFAGCRLLTVLDIPDTLKEIGDFAFSGCASLADVQLGEKVNRIGDGAFAGCDSLQEITIDEDNTYFTSYGGALYNHDKTRLIQVYAGSKYTKYTMPEKVNEIRPYAFWGCDKLRFASLSAYIKEIPAYGMSNCGLEEIVLPYSLNTISMKAFADCTVLKKAEIPPTVHTIHETAFDGCPNLVIVSEPGSAARKYDDGREKGTAAAAEYEDTQGANGTDSRYPVSAGEDGNGGSGTDRNTADAASSVTGAAVSGGDRTIGQASVVGGQAFVFIDNTNGNVYGGTENRGAAKAGSGGGSPTRSVSSGSGLQFPDNGAALTEKTQTEEEEVPAAEAGGTEPAGETGFADTAEGEKGGFPKYTIAGDRIAAQAYYKDRELTSYEIPAQIRRIGDFSFARSGLQAVTIPEGVEEIGYGAFYHCDDLEQVVIPSSVTSVEPSAFEHTKWMDNWLNGGNVNDYLVVGDGILLAYKGGDSRITVPEGVRQIGPGVFRDHKGITSVSLPNTLEIIGEDAFAGCTNLTAVSGGVAVQVIRDRAFEGCPLSTVRIPDTVTRIGLRAYDAQESLKNKSHAVVFMGSSLPEVGYEKTATRLSNEDCRDLAFNGVQVAVVSDTIQDYEGTVLDEKLYGFRGLICSVLKEASGTEEGLLKVKASTLGTRQAPESVTIYGSVYRFDAQSLADARKAEEERTGNAQSPGTGTEAAVKIVSNSSVFPDTSGMSAFLQEGGGPYYLVLRDSSEAGQSILNAYRTLYREESDPSLYGFDITLYDETRSIPITRLGNSSMKIKMPVPKDLAGGKVHLVCTDEDGQLEEVDYQSYTLDGVPYMEWTARHFSPYGIYSYEGSRPAVQGGGILTALFRQKDASPDTGDLIHPKWFLAAGLLAASVAVFLSGRKNMIQIKSGT